MTSQDLPRLEVHFIVDRLCYLSGAYPFHLAVSVTRRSPRPITVFSPKTILDADAIFPYERVQIVGFDNKTKVPFGAPADNTTSSHPSPDEAALITLKPGRATWLAS